MNSGSAKVLSELTGFNMVPLLPKIQGIGPQGLAAGSFFDGIHIKNPNGAEESPQKEGNTATGSMAGFNEMSRMSVIKLSKYQGQTTFQIPKSMEIKFRKEMQQLKFYQTLNN